MKWPAVNRKARCVYRRRRGSLGKNWKRFALTVGSVEIHLVGRAGWGYTAWAWTSPRGYCEAWPGIHSYEGLSHVKKKKKPTEQTVAKHLAALESNVFAKMHSLVAHCAITQYDDGDVRQPGWVTIKTFGSTWQVEAKDPDTCQFMRVVQPSLDDALVMLSMLLDQEDAPWEHDVWAAAQKAKKKK